MHMHKSVKSRWEKLSSSLIIVDDTLTRFPMHIIQRAKITLQVRKAWNIAMKTRLSGVLLMASMPNRKDSGLSFLSLWLTIKS